MNSIKRVVGTVGFEKTDRVPVIAQVFGHAARLADTKLSDYLTNGEVLAKCQINALKRYGYDAVFALLDVNVETEAMGSVLDFKEDDYAHIKKYFLTKDTNIDSLEVPDPTKAGRMPEILKAANILRNKVGEETVVVGCVLGPLTVATQAMGCEEALFLATDDPDKFGKILDYCTESAITFAEAQLAAGAHVVVTFDPSASPAVVPPSFFREFEMSRLKRLFDACKKVNAPANWLHIAGPVQPILADYPSVGADIANFDYCLTADEAKSLLPETCVDGNIRPLAFVDSTVDQVEKEAAALLESFGDRGGFILSSGCEIPPEANPDTISAMVTAARKYAGE